MILLGKKYKSQLESALNTLDSELIWLEDNPKVDIRLCGHTDLSAFYDGNKNLWLAGHLKSVEFIEKVEKKGIFVHFPEPIQGKKYPQDALFNISLLNHFLIYNDKTASKDIIQYVLNNSAEITPILVRQGYTACSILSLNGEEIITADAGIERACSKQGIHVTKITPTEIRLDGFSCGFIGGCGFKYCNFMVLTGTLDLIPEKDLFLDALYRNDLKPYYLTDEPLFDIGGAIWIK